MGLKLLIFRWFQGFEKLFFTIKLSIKLDWQKIKKIPHAILGTIISQTISQKFCKIGLNSEELELLNYALFLTFSIENR